MPILNSTETTSLQADGSIQAHEVHTDQNGKTYDVFQTFPAGTTVTELTATMAARAIAIGTDIDMLARVAAAAHNFVLPKNKLQFMQLFTQPEFSAIQAAAVSNPQLAYYWQQFMVADSIYMSDAATVSGIELLVTAGLLTATRGATILAD